MVKWLKVASLAVVALLVAASASGTDSNTYNYQDRNGVYFNPASGQRVDATGNAQVVDADRDRDLWSVTSLINNQLTASGSGMADSNSTPVDTHHFRRMGLMLYGQLDSLSTVVRVAVQVRGHYSTASDSASTFPWYRWPVRSTTAAADVDSLGHFSTGTSALAQVTSGSGVWSGEFLVKFNVNRNDEVDGISAGKYGGFPKGIYIPLTEPSGSYFWAPYTSVRIRVLNGVRSRFKIRADLVGSAQ